MAPLLAMANTIRTNKEGACVRTFFGEVDSVARYSHFLRFSGSVHTHFMTPDCYRTRAKRAKDALNPVTTQRIQ